MKRECFGGEAPRGHVTGGCFAASQAHGVSVLAAGSRFGVFFQYIGAVLFPAGIRPDFIGAVEQVIDTGVEEVGQLRQDWNWNIEAS